MVREIVKAALEMGATEDDQPIHTFRFCRENEPLGYRIHVRSLDRRVDHFHTGILEDALELSGEQRVVVEDQVLLVAQESLR